MTLHVRQRTDSDCMLACIAMAAGKAYDEVFDQAWIDDVVERRGADRDFTNRALAHAGFEESRVWSCHVWNHHSRETLVTHLLHGRRAIISVPSLNHRDGWHVVYWDGANLFDPNDPANGKQIYRWIEQLAPCQIWTFDERRA